MGFNPLHLAQDYFYENKIIVNKDVCMIRYEKYLTYALAYIGILHNKELTKEFGVADNLRACILQLSRYKTHSFHDYDIRKMLLYQVIEWYELENDNKILSNLDVMMTMAYHFDDVLSMIDKNKAVYDVKNNIDTVINLVLDGSPNDFDDFINNIGE